MPRVLAESRRSKELSKKGDRLSWMFQPATDDETWWRHHRWQGKRDRVRAALVLCHTNEFVLNRFDECGGNALVEWSESEQRHRIRANFCRNRHCEACARSKGNLLAANLKERLKKTPDGNDRYRFITLTLKHSTTPLHQQIKRLYDSFRLLRRSAFWCGSQRGGAAILEIKWDKLTRQWHPHLHIVAEGDFLRQSTLSREWHRITGDSRIVDVRALTSQKDAAHYVCKYVSKGTSDEVWTDTEAATEWITACKGVRTCATFGSWRGYALLKVDPTHFAKDWKPIALLATLADRARRGEVAAIDFLVKLYDGPEKRWKRPQKPPHA